MPTTKNIRKGSVFIKKKYLHVAMLVLFIIIAGIYLVVQIQENTAFNKVLEKVEMEIGKENENKEGLVKELLSRYKTKINELEKLEKENEKYYEEIKELQERVKHLESKMTGQQSGKNNNTVYLTFDDGPSFNTYEVLNILEEKQVVATFFVIGNDSDVGHYLYQRMVKEGHALGNHTYTHDFEKIYQSPEAFMDDFYQLEELLYESVGVKPDIMRFPGGSNSTRAQAAGGYNVVDEIIEALDKKGYQYFDWNVSAGDAVPDADRPATKEEIVANVMNGFPENEDLIILFHDSETKKTTVEALPVIVERLKNKGYQFDVLSKDSFYLHFEN